jgi:hypothetical protein
MLCIEIIQKQYFKFYNSYIQLVSSSYFDTFLYFLIKFKFLLIFIFEAAKTFTGSNKL